MDLEHKAIERLKAASDMSLRLYKQPLVITYSGGKDNICVFCDHARDRVDVAGVYCVGGFWKKPDGTCDHYKEYQAGAAPAPSMNRDELVKALREWASGDCCGDCPAMDDAAFIAADTLENDQRHIEVLMAEIETLREQLARANAEATEYVGEMAAVAVERDSLRSQVEQLTNGQLQVMQAFQATVDGLTAERDAAVAELFNFTSAKCFICKHEGHKWLSDGKMDDLCRTCIDNYKCNWEWRGPQKEAHDPMTLKEANT